ncbi:putative copper-exporting P-type ATPase A [Candidatus Norongarragalina meridionalis]|nr:putative copper-exporting P-type ATPase A [Candidatus Norongarragalina meridionalis]
MQEKVVRMEKVEIRIDGMKCRSCADKIEAELKSMHGVESASVDLDGSKAFVNYDPQAIGIGAIREKIRGLGYSADGVAAAKEKREWTEGVLYGLLPHAGCIAFIAASVLGVTMMTEFFKPLLMNRYFFYGLIALSLVFATVSAAIYLRRNGQLSADGAKKRWKYLAAMYGSTIGVNALFFFVLFPMLANFAIAQPSVTGAVVGIVSPTAAIVSGLASPTPLPAAQLSASMQISVDIPCAGHAPLISNELKKADGVMGVQFGSPNNFFVTYDPSKTNPQAILSLDVFGQYPAKIIKQPEVAA